MGITKTKNTVRKLIKSKVEKNDEFYTQYKDVKYILSEYKEDLKDKIIYCNCDLEWSNFVKYLKDNKKEIQYKELLYTGLTEEWEFGDYCVGDFRHKKSIELLKYCDVVITNPPFSLITEWYKLIEKYDKKFIALGSLTFVSRKNVRNKFVNQEIFINDKTDKKRIYIQPDGSKKEISSFVYTNIKKIYYNYLDTTHKVCMKDCDYKFYDNTDILAITHGGRIPVDYNGLFTLSTNQCWHFDFKKYDLICFTTDYEKKLLINGQEQFVRLLCKKKI